MDWQQELPGDEPGRAETKSESYSKKVRFWIGFVPILLIGLVWFFL